MLVVVAASDGGCTLNGGIFCPVIVVRFSERLTDGVDTDNSDEILIVVIGSVDNLTMMRKANLALE